MRDHVVRRAGVSARSGLIFVVAAKNLVCCEVEDAVGVHHEGAGRELGGRWTAVYYGRGAASYGGATTLYYTSKGWVSERI